MRTYAATACWATALLLGLDGIASAQTVTIDFEGFSERTPITDQYAAYGVEFYLVDVGAAPVIATEGAPSVAWVTSYPTTRWDVGVSGVNSLTDASFQSDYGALFAFPVSQVSLALSDFGDCISVPSGVPVTATLNGYDVNDALVASDSFTINRFGGGSPNDGNVAYLSISGSGIVRAETSGVRLDCGQAIDDFTFTVEDSDGDGIPDSDDMCPDTAASDLDADVPSRRLGINRWADVDGDGRFDTQLPRGKGPGLSFSIEDTAGCNCAQIIDNLGLGHGHEKFGCSISAMEDWVAIVESSRTSANFERAPGLRVDDLPVNRAPALGCSSSQGSSQGGAGAALMMAGALGLLYRRRRNHG